MNFRAVFIKRNTFSIGIFLAQFNIDIFTICYNPLVTQNNLPVVIDLVKNLLLE